jgi:hypothetical protein
MAIGQRHPEHGARQHLRHRSLQCDRFFFCHAMTILRNPAAPYELISTRARTLPCLCFEIKQTFGLTATVRALVDP